MATVIRGQERPLSMNQNNLKGWFPAMTANWADEMNVPLQQAESV